MSNLIELPESGWVCGSLQWLLVSFEACSAWAYVWLTLDRYLAVMQPNWYRVNGEKERVKRPLIIFTVLVFILSSPFLFFLPPEIPRVILPGRGHKQCLQVLLVRFRISSISGLLYDGG